MLMMKSKRTRRSIDAFFRYLSNGGMQPSATGGPAWQTAVAGGSGSCVKGSNRYGNGSSGTGLFGVREGVSSHGLSRTNSGGTAALSELISNASIETCTDSPHKVPPCLEPIMDFPLSSNPR